MGLKGGKFIKVTQTMSLCEVHLRVIILKLSSKLWGGIVLLKGLHSKYEIMQVNKYINVYFKT